MNTKVETPVGEMTSMFEQLSENNQNNALNVLRSLVFAQAVTAKSNPEKITEETTNESA